MTIAKGQSWGEPATLPADAFIARRDSDVSVALEAARLAGESFPIVGLLGGDLCHTLGGGDDLARLRSAATAFPIDVGEVLVDGRHHYFVAHVVAHDRVWHHTAAAMNAQWLGPWNLGPKAHPNDGVLDTYQASLTISDRLKIRARLPTGSHLPHPRIRGERTAAITLTLPRRLAVAVDDRPVGTATTLAVRVLPDALRVIA